MWQRSRGALSLTAYALVMDKRLWNHWPAVNDFSLQVSSYNVLKTPSGHLRLDSHGEGRCLVQRLSMRGLHGTALETGKLLVTLDWRDPMGALFIIPDFATG